MQSETTRGQGGGWLLLVLALPLCVVVLELSLIHISEPTRL